MIRNFLRPPQSPAEFVADGVRVLAVISVFVALVWGTGRDAGVLALAMPGVLIPRFLGLRAWFDTFFGVTVLVAAWSNALDLYASISWWDLVVHFVCTGVLAVAGYLGLTAVRVLPDPRAPEPGRRVALILTPTIALALSAVWEMFEWFGHTFVSETIFVAYADTIGDMALGGLGGVCGGILLAYVPLRRADAVAPSSPPVMSTSAEDGAGAQNGASPSSALRNTGTRRSGSTR